MVSCFALLFNMDDLVGASTRLGSHGSFVDLLRVVLGGLALGIVCWFPRIGAVLAWLAIPVTIVSGSIAPTVLVSPLVCVAVTATCTLPFIIINGVVMVVGTIGIAIRWIQWVHTPVPILWTGAFLLSASTALGMALRALLGSRAERRLQDRRIAAIQKQAEQAAEHERQRLAHDMHDYVAHELTVIIAALAAARTRRPSHQQDPDQDAALLETVETTSRKALDELRRVLRLLDGEGDPVIG
ncbi:MAG: histidine kinase, partial [Acidipropionibacterium jensenii]|nr:histidine kinase [Acidipropionibacterium jensenii]